MCRRSVLVLDGFSQSFITRRCPGIAGENSRDDPHESDGQKRDRELLHGVFRAGRGVFTDAIRKKMPQKSVIWRQRFLIDRNHDDERKCEEPIECVAREFHRAYTLAYSPPCVCSLP